LIWKKRIDALGLLVVVGLLLTAVFALLFKTPQLLLLQHSAVSGLFGIAMLISLLFPRPVLFYIARSILTQNDAQRVASFNADWAFPQVRSFYRILTVVWGCFTVAQVLLFAALAFSLPISLMLTLGPILSFGTMMPVIHWSMHYARKNRGIFEQLRQQQRIDGGHMWLCHPVDHKRYSSINQQIWKHAAQRHHAATIIFTRTSLLKINLRKKGETTSAFRAG
jgi:hypothetical protein